MAAHGFTRGILNHSPRFRTTTTATVLLNVIRQRFPPLGKRRGPDFPGPSSHSRSRTSITGISGRTIMAPMTRNVLQQTQRPCMLMRVRALRRGLSVSHRGFQLVLVRDRRLVPAAGTRAANHDHLPSLRHQLPDFLQIGSLIRTVATKGPRLRPVPHEVKSSVRLIETQRIPPRMEHNPVDQPQKPIRLNVDLTTHLIDHFPEWHQQRQRASQNLQRPGRFSP